MLPTGLLATYHATAPQWIRPMECKSSDKCSNYTRTWWPTAACQVQHALQVWQDNSRAPTLRLL